jgi:hypothetical protein
MATPEDAFMNLILFQNASESAVETHFAIRNIGFPVVALLGAAALLFLLVWSVSKDEDILTEKGLRALLVLGSFQALFALFGLLTHNLIAQSVHFLFFAAPVIFVGLFGSDRRVAAQFTAITALFNFLCVLGVFPILGYSAALFDFAPDSARCVQFFRIQPQDGDPTTRCTVFANVVAVGYLLVALIQPFIVVICFAQFYDDLYRRRVAGNTVNNASFSSQQSPSQQQHHHQQQQQSQAFGGGTQLQPIQSSLPTAQRALSPSPSQYGVGPVPPSVLAQHQQGAPANSPLMRTGSAPAFGGGGFNSPMPGQSGVNGWV